MIEPSLLILSSLAEGEKHGYAMILDIEGFAGVRLGAGTLYGAITRLEQAGWIAAVASDDRRKPYRLTANGKRYLKEQIAGLGKLLRTTSERLGDA